MTDFRNRTLEYYNENADEFIAGTVGVDFRKTQDQFLGRLVSGAYILDFGCGSGRDTKYFLDKGYKVDAIDGSKELCRRARAYTGIQVRQMLFQNLDDCEKYDGIWACSSILHLPKKELKIVLKKMGIALKANGIVYTSFKHSEFEGERGERYFTDFTAEQFVDFMKEIDNLKVEDWWFTRDVRPGRGAEEWLNLILRKN